MIGLLYELFPRRECVFRKWYVTKRLNSTCINIHIQKNYKTEKKTKISVDPCSGIGPQKAL